MSIDTRTLIWLFPIAFMFHDFEELILFEPWLRKNAGAIRAQIHGRIPAFIENQINAVLGKSAAEFGFPVSLIFALVFISTFLAAAYGQYGFFLLTSGLFFIHGFMHLGQAVVMRRYIPAAISSALVVIPYGFILFNRLLSDDIVSTSALLIYFLCGAALGMPLILGMHAAGSFLYKKTIDLLVEPVRR